MSQLKTIANAAEGLGLEPVDTEFAVKTIARDILLTMREKGQITESRLEQVYKSWYKHGEWTKPGTQEKILSTLLLGPPGHGKTTTFKEAARMVADALGMEFLVNPPDDAKIGPETFLFVSQEFSAENSKMELGGIPSKKTEKSDDGSADIDYMVKLTNRRIAMLAKSGGGVLLLDDFPNASPSIQNIGLALTDEKRFQGLNLRGTYICLTGNLGSIDGTNTSRLSTALRGRCETYFIQDKSENFINRNRQHYQDELGDGGISLFLERHPESFAAMPSVKESGGFAAPRNWDNLAVKVRQDMRDVGGRGEALAAMPAIRRRANSIVGKVAGEAYHAFMYAMMQSADPLAREAIYNGKMNMDVFGKRFKDGLSSDQQHFAYQFASALVDYAVNKIATEWDSGKMVVVVPGKDPVNSALQTYITRFGHAVLLLKDDSFGFALNELTKKLAVRIPSLAQSTSANPDINTAAKQALGMIIAQDKSFDPDKRETLISTLSNADKFEKRAKTRARGPSA